MSVEIWFGHWPPDDASQSMVGEIYRLLNPQPVPYVAMFNFIPPGGREIDLVVMKRDYIFVVEHKYCEWKIIGSTEGPWKSYEPKPDGTFEEHVMNPVNSSPFHQMRAAYEKFVNWCSEKHEEISKDVERVSFVNWRKARSYVVISPSLHKESQITMGGPTKCLGRDYFLTYELVQASIKSEIELTEIEMGRIPKMLNLNYWTPPSVDRSGNVEKTSLLQGSWKLEPFAELVAYGHQACESVFRLSEIEKKVITIGRAPDNDLVIRDKSVSAHHAQIVIEIHPNGELLYMVSDLESSNGTHLAFNGKLADERRIQPNTRFCLRNTSMVRFGSTGFTFLQQKEQLKS